MRLSSEVLDKVTFLSGSADLAAQILAVPAQNPFDDTIIDFLNDVSKNLMSSREAKEYSDVVTFGFWIRRGSVLKLKERFKEKEALRLGRGVAFHIAPSNVPVNFAYSLVTGLLMGNANIVRVPSKDFPQITIIINAINEELEKHGNIKPYVLCVRYEHDRKINDLLSSVADVRIVWGGDQTISELRKSLLPPRAVEITFADRYSLAIIDSDSYLASKDRVGIAEDFYNDTFFSDQNACTSPRIIVWTGKRISRAKKAFWEEEHRLVRKKYKFQPIQGVNKLVRTYLIASSQLGVKVAEHSDNLIIRVSVPKITDFLMNYYDNSGFFYEYDCEDIMDLVPLCNDKRCQTIAYIGDKDIIMPLIKAGIKGVDRVVPMGRTMDFDLIWDGYNLTEFLTRTVSII